MGQTIYAVMDGDTIINLAVADDPAFATEQGWLGPIASSPDIGIGSTTPDNGKTWTPPPPVVVPQSEIDQDAIVADLIAQQPQIQALIAANPSGITLDPPQTLAIVEIVNNLGLLLLGDASAQETP